MNDEERQHIAKLRDEGRSSAEIAKSLGMSANTIRSFLRRESAKKSRCKHCGQALINIPKAKPKTFCSDTCRYAWWNKHRSQMHTKAVYLLKCAYCGKEFNSYASLNRKYCCHPCYVRHRYGVP
jgi:ribosomal protein L34E